MSVQDKFEYTKVIRNLKSKDRQCHRQNKKKDNKTNHFLQNTTQKHEIGIEKYSCTVSSFF